MEIDSFFIPPAPFSSPSINKTIYFLKNEFIGVPFANKILYISGLQVYNISSVYYTVCSLHQVKSLILPFIPPLSSGNQYMVMRIFCLFVFLNPFTFFFLLSPATSFPKSIYLELCTVHKGETRDDEVLVLTRVWFSWE